MNECCRHRRRWYWWCGFVLLLVLTAPATAHNGALAIAVPVEGITVDGDLSEWPQGLTRYSIAFPEMFERPKDTEDYQGDFRIAYNERENALYLAVEMHDDSVVLDTASTNVWNAHDGCEIYVDARHAKSGEIPIGQYFMRDAPGVFGSEANLADFSVAVQRERKALRFEWRIDIGKSTQGQVNLRPGRSLGFDIDLCDKDADGSWSWMAWGSRPNKFVSAKLGDVLLVAEPVPSPVGIQGRVHWEGGQEGVAHAQVEVASGSMWVQVAADAQGEFAVPVPPGKYQIHLTWPGHGGPIRQVETKLGQGARVELIAPEPRGKQVPAGPGKGQWRTWGLTDGLVHPFVTTVYQDSKGNMWFGTDGGVTHFDGRKTTTFTTGDGLANNGVTAIREDREGNMWFGTYGGGVSRYDGQTFSTLTTRDGLASNQVLSIHEDRQGRLWFGTAGGVSRYEGGEFVTLTTQHGLADNFVMTIGEDRTGNLWFRNSRYDGESFHALTTLEGLGSSTVYAIAEDRNGNVWFGTKGGGVSRYDGRNVLTLTSRDGLASNDVYAIKEDREGALWFGTYGSGVSRFDGKGFITFTVKDGLAGNIVTSITEDREGILWFGTDGGVSQYQGEQFRTFTTADGLLDNRVSSILEDTHGTLWFGLVDLYLDFAGQSLGASRYNGTTFHNFSPEDGLQAHEILFLDVLQDHNGNLWFGPVRYDGRHFRVYTDDDGTSAGFGHLLEDQRGTIWAGMGWAGTSRLERDYFVPFHQTDGMAGVVSLLEDRHRNIWLGTGSGKAVVFNGDSTRAIAIADSIAEETLLALLEDQDGKIWAGTYRSGVASYDGQDLRHWSMKQGLAGNTVNAILQDHDGRMLFSSFGGGLSLFDGRVFQNLTTQDGLADNRVTDLLQDRHGDIWISTLGGVTRYRPYRTPSPIQITEVTADRRYGPVQEINLSTSQDYLAFEFQGRSLKTRPGQMAYVYRLQGYDGDWRVTREERVMYADLPRGDYAFEVKAVDRDLTYSEAPATVQVKVHLPYKQLLLYGMLVVALVGLGLTSGMAMRRRRALLREQQARLQAQEQLNRELEDELQTAHDLQMGLMPQSPPHIPGLDLAGQCIPANHVGGDFFQYFQQGSTLSLCLADVTGHAMEAAVPGLMFSGVLKSQVELGEPLDLLFQRLNRTLHSTLEARTFVCFVMGQYDPATGIFRLADAGCPYPYHYRAATGTVEELRVEAYPLGVRAEGRYPVLQTTLAPGDRVVFCSDGVIEAVNAAGEMFGFERTGEVVRRGCQEGLSAEGLLERIMQEVKVFRGEVAQGDDQTVVVLRVIA